METMTKPNYVGMLKKMNGAIRVLEMYPQDHPAIHLAIKKPFSALQEIFKGVDHLTISQTEDRIIINGTGIEGTSLPERLLQEFKNENINSININKALEEEEFNSFLGFFVKPVGKDVPSKSLPEFLKEKDIHSIRVDQLHYELVSENEVVVANEVLQGAELKTQISKIIRDNPGLVRDLLLNKSTPKEDIEGRFGPEVDLNQLSGQIKDQVKELSDDDLLNLLASSLEKNLTKFELFEPDSPLNEMVNLVFKLLEDRDKRKLLPQIKNMLSERGLLEKKHLDYIFDERWIKSQAVLDELTGMIGRLGSQEVDSERFMFLWNRVNSTQESEIKTYVMDQLLSQLYSENLQSRNLALDFLKSGLIQFVKEETGFGFNYITHRLSEKIGDQNLPVYAFQNSAELLRIILLEKIRKEELKEALPILVEFNNRLKPGIICPAEIVEVASAFIREITDEQSLFLLTHHLKEGIPMPTIKLVEEILESLDKDRVAEKLLEICTSADRATRMSSLRVLNRLGHCSVSAISSLLSTDVTFVREKERGHLVDDAWYKIRNAIYVLSNIPGEESALVLSRLKNDPDIRVRLEVAKALEKIGIAESTNILLTFLDDPEDEVRKSAITSLVGLNDKSCLGPLLEHFRHNPDDRLPTLLALGKIGGGEPTEEESYTCSIQFLLGLLSEEDVTIKQLQSKQRDEMQIMALNILGKIGSPEFVVEIEKFVKNKKRGLKGLLVNDRLIESAHRASASIKSKRISDTAKEPDVKPLERETVK
ncbi:MAG: HEAT repeat domain-containing protein [Candidatus Zixiibacteriota bacterium]